MGERGVYGGLEAGGTKFVCLLGTGPDDITDVERIEVGEPGPTIAAAAAYFRRVLDRGVPLRAIGIGSFGPLELRRDHPRYGWITTTPKPGWSGVDLLGPFRAFGVPLGFDTDVNVAAIAEGRWGAARGLGTHVYLTIGTGIGGGGIADGRLLHGLGHPEMGHVPVRRMPGDDFPGRCPFHGDCFEGMGSGPAIMDRFGRRAETLEGADLARAAAIGGHYLASGVASLTYALAPERFVVGGGLANVPGLIDAARAALPGQLGGYPGMAEHGAADFLVPAGLGGLAGPAGCLALAEAAAVGA